MEFDCAGKTSLLGGTMGVSSELNTFAFHSTEKFLEQQVLQRQLSKSGIVGADVQRSWSETSGKLQCESGHALYTSNIGVDYPSQFRCKHPFVTSADERQTNDTIPRLLSMGAQLYIMQL